LRRPFFTVRIGILLANKKASPARGNPRSRRANMAVKKNTKPATKGSKKGKKISGKKELAKAQTLFSTRSLYKPGL
jgi:hypothetical protein